MSIRKINFSEINTNSNERLRLDKLVNVAVYYHLKEKWPDLKIVTRSKSSISSRSEVANSRKIYDDKSHIPDYDLVYQNTIHIGVGEQQTPTFIIDTIVVLEFINIIATNLYGGNSFDQKDYDAIKDRIESPGWIDNEDILDAVKLFDSKK